MSPEDAGTGTEPKMFPPRQRTARDHLRVTVQLALLIGVALCAIAGLLISGGSGTTTVVVTLVIAFAVMAGAAPVCALARRSTSVRMIEVTDEGIVVPATFSGRPVTIVWSALETVREYGDGSTAWTSAADAAAQLRSRRLTVGPRQDNDALFAAVERRAAELGVHVTVHRH